MSGALVEVKMDCVANLKGLLVAVADFKPALRTCGLYMYKSIARTFTTQGHGTWLPLAPATIARRRKKSNLPLLDTRRLSRSVMGKGGDSVYTLTKTYLVIGTNVEYAAVHQYGHTFVRVVRPGKAVLRWMKKKNGSTGWAFASKGWQSKHPKGGVLKAAHDKVQIRVQHKNAKTGKTRWVWKNATKEQLDSKGKLKAEVAMQHKTRIKHFKAKAVASKQMHVSWAGGKHADRTDVYYQTIPARPFLVIWEEDEKVITEIVADYVKKGWNK